MDRQPASWVLSWDKIKVASHEKAIDLRNEIERWGDQFHLTDDWLLSIALLTLWGRHEWTQEMEARREACLPTEPFSGGLPREPIKKPSLASEPTGFADEPFADVADASPFVMELPPFRVEYPAWHPTWKTRAAYLEPIHRDLREYMHRLNNQVRTYIDARQAEAQQNGASPAPSKREADRHLQWLIRWQIQGWNRRQIQREYNASPDTIRDALRSTAKDIGISLRHGKAGRPPKP